MLEHSNSIATLPPTHEGLCSFASIDCQGLSIGLAGVILEELIYILDNSDLHRPLLHAPPPQQQLVVKRCPPVLLLLLLLLCCSDAATLDRAVQGEMQVVYTIRYSVKVARWRMNALWALAECVDAGALQQCKPTRSK